MCYFNSSLWSRFFHYLESTKFLSYLYLYRSPAKSIAWNYPDIHQWVNEQVLCACVYMTIILHVKWKKTDIKGHILCNPIYTHSSQNKPICRDRKLIGGCRLGGGENGEWLLNRYGWWKWNLIWVVIVPHCECAKWNSSVHFHKVNLMWISLQWGKKKKHCLWCSGFNYNAKLSVLRAGDLAVNKTHSLWPPRACSLTWTQTAL